MKDLVIENIDVSPFSVRDKGEREAVSEAVTSRTGYSPDRISFIKKSIDARNKRNVTVKYKVLARFDGAAAETILSSGKGAEYIIPDTEPSPEVSKPFSALVVGTGPAGLFCALRLVRAGIRVTMIERGKPLAERDADVIKLKEHGTLDPESNILFGEGGAGTYSDGKLTSRIHKGPIDLFYRELCEFGAPESVLYDAKPHVGTDLLSGIIGRVREFIQTKGEVRFREKADSLIVSNGRVSGVKTSSGKIFEADAVILATGHSARDTYGMLKSEGVALEAKGFAIGVRAEHPSAFINRAQYGDFVDILPAADYRLAWTDPASKRGVYSFCMCPGGEVINSSSQEGLLCVNGMSLSARDSEWSNAAIVVSVNPGDFGDPLAGIGLQRDIEKKAFDLGGGRFSAPAQRVASFARKENGGGKLPFTPSYKPGTKEAALWNALPRFISDPLCEGLARFDKIIPGFANGICIGVETRTSSPVRIVRDENFQSVSHPGLYPVGEGAGYAGGITSSAVDGIKCADAIIDSLR
jgi:uncharacterized FAD-dependent dehydrogenase